MLNKGEYVGHEPAVEDNVNSDLPSHTQLDTHSINSVTIKKRWQNK